MNKSSTPFNTLFHCFEQGIIFNEWNCRSLKWNRPEVITFLCSTLLGLLKNDNPVLRARSSFLRWPWSEEFILSLSSTISKSILVDKELNLTMAECTPVFRTKTKMIAGNINLRQEREKVRHNEIKNKTGKKAFRNRHIYTREVSSSSV